MVIRGIARNSPGQMGKEGCRWLVDLLITGVVQPQSCSGWKPPLNLVLDAESPMIYDDFWLLCSCSTTDLSL